MKACLIAANLLVAALALALYSCPAHAGLSEDAGKAVILSYHRIGEDTYPDISLRLQQFEEQIAEIENGGYNVISLPAFLTAMQSQTPLPDKTLILTFQGAYGSAARHAFPLLMEKNIPFTVFYAPEMLPLDHGERLSWEELRALAAHKEVSLGLIPGRMEHLSHAPRVEILRALNKARQIHREQLGEEASYLAYPFGEYSREFQDLARSQGFTAALGLQSGPAYPGINLFAIPRFSMTEDYGDIDRFRMISATMPLPVDEVEPPDFILPDNESAAIGFTLPPKLEEHAENLSCFMSGYGKVKTESLGRRIEIRSDIPASEPRLRLNCTLPAGNMIENDDSAATAHWRWIGLLFHRPPAIPLASQDEPPAPPE